MAPSRRQSVKQSRGNLADKLRSVEAEVDAFFAHCKKHDLSEDEVRQLSRPLLEAVVRSRRRHVVQVVGGVVGVLCLLYIMTSLSVVQQLNSVIFRLFTLSVLPYWDWTDLYYEECLVRNPQYDQHKLYWDDCQVCEDLEELPRLTADQRDVTAQYMRRDVPLLTAAGRDWPDLERIKSLEDLYTVSSGGLFSAPSCSLTSNLRLRSDQADRLLSQVISGQVDNFWATWEICDIGAARVLRSVVGRPQMLPLSVELSKTSTVLVARNHPSRTFKTVFVSSQLTVLTQLVGESEVRLEPRHPCNTSCLVITDTLSPGDTVTVTDLLWKISWLPVSDTGDVIAVGFGGYHD